MKNNLKAINLSKKFDENILFSDINLNLNPGDFLLLKGDNGVGKTSLLKVLIGLLSSDSGKQEYLSDKRFKSNIGYFSSNFNSFFNRLSVLQNITFFLEMRGYKKEKINESISFLFKELGVEKKLLNKKYMHLSSGEKKIVSLIRCFAHNPKFIFMDEPLISLDYKIRQNLINFLRNKVMTKEVILIIISHDIKELNEFKTGFLELLGKGKHNVGYQL